MMLSRIADWKPPKMTWHKVRVREDCSGFLYRDRGGEMQHAGPGEVHEVDLEALEVARRKHAVVEL